VLDLLSNGFVYIVYVLIPLEAHTMTRVVYLDRAADVSRMANTALTSCQLDDDNRFNTPVAIELAVLAPA
jgi:hypothetical protein